MYLTAGCTTQLSLDVPHQGPHAVIPALLPQPPGTLTLPCTCLLSPHSYFTDYSSNYQVRKRISNCRNSVNVNSLEGTCAEGWPVKIFKSFYSPQILSLFSYFTKYVPYLLVPYLILNNFLFCNNYRLTGSCKNSTGSRMCPSPSFLQWQDLTHNYSTSSKPTY